MILCFVILIKLSFFPASSCRETGREEEEQEGSRENGGRELILAPVPRSLQCALSLLVGERRGE